MQEIENLLSEAQSLAQDGYYAEARLLVKDAIALDRYHIEAWWALAQLAHTDKERRDALYHVLALDPHHMHANHMFLQLKAGTLDRLSPPIKREKLQRVERDYFMPAVLTMVGYILFWIAGLAMNFYFLHEARQLSRQPETTVANQGCLGMLLAVFVILPVLATMLGLWSLFALT